VAAVVVLPISGLAVQAVQAVAAQAALIRVTVRQELQTPAVAVAAVQTTIRGLIAGALAALAW
jgi:hypothetical protein